MNTSSLSDSGHPSDSKSSRPCSRSGFTLVELLVVISIIGLLAAILIPAISLVRTSARKSACASNLQQFGHALQARAVNKGTFCSGAFDWQHDGAVTETGWVADMVNSGVPAGSMLCPANDAQVSETYEQLLRLGPASFEPCVKGAGSTPKTAPDGTIISNPCRTMLTVGGYEAGTAQRTDLILEKIYKKHYNTNYTASWFMVRGGANLDSSGNLRRANAACSAGLRFRNSTLGPLKASQADNAVISRAFIPLLADGGTITTTLSGDIGEEVAAGSELVRSFTSGPLLISSMSPPAAFGAGTAKSSWWPVWAKQTRQEYASFAPVHGGDCNVLFADGSVRSFTDTNGDGYLNNGFGTGGASPYESNEIEIEPAEFESLYSLSDRSAHES